MVPWLSGPGAEVRQRGIVATVSARSEAVPCQVDNDRDCFVAVLAMTPWGGVTCCH